MRESPCKKDCPDRSPTCHGSCPKYAEFRKESEKIYEDRRKSAMLHDYQAQKAIKIMKIQKNKREADKR